MKTARSSAGNEVVQWWKQSLALLLSLTLLFVTLPPGLSAQDTQAPPSQENQAPPPENSQAPPPGDQQPQYAPQGPEQLQRLVAPIALYPDSLVAQILAASTFPDQVVEADRCLQEHPDLKGEALGKEVDQQPWDPSVKALTAFPSVLGNMDKNLSWTSSLGDAYYNQQQDVMDAVQVMRHKAQAAGNLKSTPQQVVSDQGSDVDIEPADPDTVYVPAYDPWLVYGYPVVAWPGWYPYPGIWFGGPYLSFGLGFGIGWFGGFGWGWGHWGFDWRNHYVMFNHGRYFSQSRTFYNRSNFYRGAAGRGGAIGGRGGARGGTEAARGGTEARGPSGERGGVFNRPGATARPFEGNRQAARGFAEPRGQSGVRSGAFSGYGHGGQTKSFSSRGRSSFGGGAARGGGGHSGGGGHGGRH
ncbi:MAG: DUF3300 domain-containing protein [Terriglobales bacterium]